MNYQEKILKHYHDIFPNMKLREISEQTGIQMTRVFRILNGSEMKISEFEKFERVINNKTQNGSHSQIFKNFRNYLELLSSEKLKKLNREILNHFQALSYSNEDSSYFHKEAKNA